MSPETLKTIVTAALEAAKVITKITPNTWDDKIAQIAEVIVNEVLGLISSDGAGLDDATQEACYQAAQKIKAVV